MSPVGIAFLMFEDNLLFKGIAKAHFENTSIADKMYLNPLLILEIHLRLPEYFSTKSICKR
jgi:hypothetical protein